MIIVVHRVLTFTQEIKDVDSIMQFILSPHMIDKLTENNKITILSYKILQFKTIEQNNFKLNNGFLPMSLPKGPIRTSQFQQCQKTTKMNSNPAAHSALREKYFYDPTRPLQHIPPKLSTRRQRSSSQTTTPNSTPLYNPKLRQDIEA